MNSDQVSRYIDDLSHALRSRGAFDASLLAEMRDHLSDAAEAGIRRGLPADVAQGEAIARFGEPDVLAAQVAAGIPRWRRRALLALCAATILSSAYLSLSLLILRPPRADYAGWFVEAALFVVQGTLTIVALTFSGTRSWWSRSLLSAGGIAIAGIGGRALYGAVAGHVEGYGLLLGLLLSIQGLVTIQHFHRRAAHLATRSS